MSKKRKNKRKPRRQKKIKVVYRKLGREKVLGWAFIGDNYIEVDKSLKGKRLLKILVHEIGHQIFPDISESQILNLEKIMGNTLWEQGYRRVDNSEY